MCAARAALPAGPPQSTCFYDLRRWPLWRTWRTCWATAWPSSTARAAWWARSRPRALWPRGAGARRASRPRRLSAAVWLRGCQARRCSALRPSVALVACLERCRSVSPLPCRLRSGGVLLPWCWACACRRAPRSRRATISPRVPLAWRVPPAPRRRWLAAAVGAARWRRDGVPPYGLRPRTLAPRLAASDGRAPVSLATSGLRWKQFTYLCVDYTPQGYAELRKRGGPAGGVDFLRKSDLSFWILPSQDLQKNEKTGILPAL